VPLIRKRSLPEKVKRENWGQWANLCIAWQKTVEMMALNLAIYKSNQTNFPEISKRFPGDILTKV